MNFGCTYEVLHNSFSEYSLKPKADVMDCWSTHFVPSKVRERVEMAFFILFKKHFKIISVFLASVPTDMMLR